MNFINKTFSVMFRIDKTERLDKTDVSFLQIALMVAALDGAIDPAEFALFERHVRKCVGYTAATGAAARETAMRGAGYLMAARACVGEKKVPELFLSEVANIIKFARAIENPRRLRRAFILWTAMAMADGAYSKVEREALALLHARLRTAALDYATEQYSQMSARSRGYIPPDERAALVERIMNKRWPADFPARVEKALKKLESHPDAKAANALREMMEFRVEG